MKMTKCESGLLKEHGYEPSTGLMHLRFASGRLFEYSGVPQKVYDDLVAAPSMGKYFNQSIKGRFESTPIEEPK